MLAKFDEPLSRLLVLARHGLLSRRSHSSSIGRLRRRPARSQARSQRGSEECGREELMAI